MSVQVQKELKDAHLLLARRPLPSASLESFFTDATGGYPGGVWYGSFRYVTARPATEAPVIALALTGSSLHGGVQRSKQSNTARTATSVALGTPTSCQPGTLRMVMWRCKRSRPVEVYGRCDPCLHEDPGQVD